MLLINNILNWNFNKTSYSKKGLHVINYDTQEHIEENILKLNELSYSLSIQKPTNIEHKEDILNKFIKTNKLELENNDFSKRETSILIETLDYEDSLNNYKILLSSDFEFAIYLIDTNWRDSFITKLWDVYLRNWHVLTKKENKVQGDLLIKFIKNKCKNYHGNRPNIINIKNNIHIFRAYDPIAKYIELLFKQNIDIENANTLINHGDYVLRYEFFNILIERYLSQIDYKNISKDKLSSIYTYLNKTDSKKIILLCCSVIINKNNKGSHLSKTIEKFTIKLIGDPNDINRWSISGVNEQQDDSIENARVKFNIWLNEHFIDIFFRKLVDDNRRKEYWLKFINQINDIKIVGNKSNYYKLKNIESISKYVDVRYKITKRNQQTSALIIYSKRFVFVVFTDVGALYIYKQSNFKLNLNTIDSIEDLKMWSRDKYACKNADQSGYVILNKEGRFIQSGNWESRLNVWMRKYYYGKK